MQNKILNFLAITVLLASLFPKASAILISNKTVDPPTSFDWYATAPDANIILKEANAMSAMEWKSFLGIAAVYRIVTVIHLFSPAGIGMLAFSPEIFPSASKILASLPPEFAGLSAFAATAVGVWALIMTQTNEAKGIDRLSVRNLVRTKILLRSVFQAGR